MNKAPDRDLNDQNKTDTRDDAEEDNDPDNLFYKSPEERREAGLGQKINDWLTISALLEIEREQQRTRLEGAK